MGRRLWRRKGRQLLAGERGANHLLTLLDAQRRESLAVARTRRIVERAELLPPATHRRRRGKAQLTGAVTMKQFGTAAISTKPGRELPGSRRQTAGPKLCGQDGLREGKEQRAIQRRRLPITGRVQRWRQLSCLGPLSQPEQGGNSSNPRDEGPARKLGHCALAGREGLAWTDLQGCTRMYERTVPPQGHNEPPPRLLRRAPRESRRVACRFVRAVHSSDGGRSSPDVPVAVPACRTR